MSIIFILEYTIMSLNFLNYNKSIHCVQYYILTTMSIIFILEYTIMS